MEYRRDLQKGGLSFHSTESNQEGLLKLKARICIVDWLLRRQERSKSAQVSKLELMIYRFLRWQRCNTLTLQILAIFEKVGSTVNHFNIKSIILSNILFCFMSFQIFIKQYASMVFFYCFGFNLKKKSRRKKYYIFTINS